MFEIRIQGRDMVSSAGNPGIGLYSALILQCLLVLVAKHRVEKAVGQARSEMLTTKVHGRRWKEPQFQTQNGHTTRMLRREGEFNE